MVVLVEQTGKNFYLCHGCGARMTPAFQLFMERLQNAQDKQSLGDALGGFAGAFGLTRFAHLGFPRPSPHPPTYVTS